MSGVRCAVFLRVFSILWTLTFAQTDVADTEVSCIFMEDCILPCSFQGSTDAEIQWTTMIATHGPVHSYQGNQDLLENQDQRFKGRTSLLKDQISRGNASLQLTEVEVLDQGRYRCYTSTISGNNESFINLQVDAPVHEVDILEVEHSIICSSEGIYPAPGLTWTTDPPSDVPIQSKTEVQQTEQRLYNIRSSLKLSDLVTDVVYICTVSTRRNREEAVFEMPFPYSWYSDDVRSGELRSILVIAVAWAAATMAAVAAAVVKAAAAAVMAAAVAAAAAVVAAVAPATPAVAAAAVAAALASIAAAVAAAAPSAVAVVVALATPVAVAAAVAVAVAPPAAPVVVLKVGLVAPAVAAAVAPVPTAAVAPAVVAAATAAVAPAVAAAAAAAAAVAAAPAAVAAEVFILTLCYVMMKPKDQQENSQRETVTCKDREKKIEPCNTEMEEEVDDLTETALQYSHLQTSSADPGLRRRDSSCLPHSHSEPSLSQKPSPNTKNSTRAQSLPDVSLEDSFEEFSPYFTVDENEETYRFRCSRPGLYQCRVTGLVFHMDGEGDVVYRVVPWNCRLLARLRKKPAGPLFDIKCPQQCLSQLHLPHCEIRSTGGCEYLSVAHLNDEGIEFIPPHMITETHVIINITGLSDFGVVKNQDSPPDPVRALVLLFYRPPTDLDPQSLLNVLLLPKNTVLHDVQRTRKKLVGNERYIEASPNCKLQPDQEYTLSTSPGDNLVRVQPREAEFYYENYKDYYPSFQVILRTVMKNIELFLKDKNSSSSVWESEVCLSSSGERKSCGPGPLNPPSTESLRDIRTNFIEGISGPVLKSLLDKLLGKKVIIDSERESADEIRNQRDKARFVIDTVRKKGEAASSEMIEFLREDDPFLCEHLGLI